MTTAENIQLKKIFVNNIAFIIMRKKSLSQLLITTLRDAEKNQEKNRDISEQKHLLSQVSQTSLYKSRVINTIGRYEVIKILLTHTNIGTLPHTHLDTNHKMRICCLEMNLLNFLSSFSRYCMLKNKC